MGHMLEQYGEMASFASLRQPAWHGLGTVLDVAVTTSEMLVLAILSYWDVRQEPIDLPGRYHGGDYFANVRTNPFDGETDVLGIVGARYKVFQNEELFSFGDNILDGGGTWETAGSIKNGTVVFGALSLNREITVNGETTDNYLLVSTSHDGSHPIQASVTPIRVVCNNTLTFAIGKGGRKAKQSFRIRHTQTTEGRVAEARQALGVAHAYLDAFEDEMKELNDALTAAGCKGAQLNRLNAAIQQRASAPQPKGVAKANATSRKVKETHVDIDDKSEPDQRPAAPFMQLRST